MQSWVVMFTGQGSQQIGMGKDLDTLPDSRAVWDCACDITGFDVRRLCWKGPMNKLAQTRYQQVAITAVNLAGWYSLKAAAALPETPVLIGHSVGEYSALHAAGVLSLESTFQAVHTRANLMQAQADKIDGAMYAVKNGQSTKVQSMIDQMGLTGQVVIANDNSPRQVVIAGLTEQVKAVSMKLAETGLATVKLPVNGAWHSPLMIGMLPEFSALLNRLDMQLPIVPVLMNRTAREPSSLDEIRNNLTVHVTDTVRWRETIGTLLQRGLAHFLEIGPRKILCSLLSCHGEAGAQVQAIHCQQLLKTVTAQKKFTTC